MNTRKFPLRSAHAITQARRWLLLARPALVVLGTMATLLPVLMSATPARAGSADIANVPLGTATITAKPNVMFILDDSGSMGWDFLPDSLDENMVGGGRTPIGRCDTNRYACLASQCNGVAFDPTEDYPLPVDAAGIDYLKASLTAPLDDGYDTDSGSSYPATGTRDARKFYYTYNGTQKALDWKYNANGSLITSDFTRECFATTGSLPAIFELKDITQQSAELQQKYANWWSYYRTRQLLMRSAVGLSFKSLDSNYRVGFSAISDQTITSSKFLDVKDFDTNQRKSFYDKLYTVPTGGGTPLRGALSKIGSYYGKAVSGQSYDPAEYSTTNPVTGVSTTAKYECQRNYSILSTDGYWNRNNFSGNLPSTYLNGFKLDGESQVGQQDGAEARPMRDGKSTTITTTTTTGTVDRQRTDTTTVSDSTITRTEYLVRALPRGSCGTNNARYDLQVVQQRGARTSSVVSSLFEDVTTSATTTKVDRDGVVTTTSTDPRTTRATVNTTVAAPVVATTWSDISSSTTTCLDDTTNNNGVRGASNRVVPRNFQLAPVAYFTGENRTAGPTPRPAVTATAVTTSTRNLPGTPVVNSVTLPGDSNTLADIAEYYYVTDLRPDIADNVKPAGRDVGVNQQQHMTTYTIGLGVRGSLDFDPDYLIGEPKGDYGALVNGTKQWPVPTGTTSTTDVYDATHVDDLWHAAVNGRGQYFSASTAGSLSDAITSSLKDVTAARGTAAAAASSTLTPSASDDWLFLTRYNSAPTWNGNLLAYKFTFSTDPATLGQLIQPDTSAGNEKWSVQAKLDSRDPTTRKVKFNSGGTLMPFTYDNLSAAQQAYFDNRCSGANATPTLTQCAAMKLKQNATTLLDKVTGTNLVNFLTGDNTLLLNSTDVNNQIWRSRVNRMGDIVHSSPVYVGKPDFNYTDAGYASFVSQKANRTKVVLAGANDGMLHAFKVAEVTDTTAGDELWAYVPSKVIPDLWHLADSEYDNNHRYYVDMTPEIGDVYDGANWHTIVVGGLGGGGRGYYALDITDPADPIFLWEFEDKNLGFSYSNPVITKNKDKKWVVAFTSGYNNNVSQDTTSGKGRLFIVDALKGVTTTTPLVEIITSAGDSTTPSNLGRLNAWVDKDTDNTALRYYAGDMLGNLWRFDPDDRHPPAGVEAVLLGQARGPAPDSAIQPITAMPRLSEITFGTGRYAVISFGTGRYLGDSDLTDATTQSIYNVKDTLDDGAGLGVFRGTPANLTQQTMGSDHKLTSPSSIDWKNKNGWFVDLDKAKRERIYLDGTPTVPGALAFASVVPNGDPCSAGGVSWIYDIDLKSGLIVQATLSNVPIVGTGVVVSIDSVQGLDTDLGGLAKKRDDRKIVPLSGGVVKRTSWRELQD